MAQADKDATPVAQPEQRRIEVLAVDDERVNLILLKGFLKDLEVEVIMSGDGAEALELASTHDVALVLLDVMMPGMNGFELAERLRANDATRHVPIIFITAISKEQRHIFKGYELGAVDYLFKPLEPEVLVGKVGVFIELHRRKQALAEFASELEHTVARLEKSEKALRHQAFHDDLTGLANRSLLKDRLTHALEVRRRSSDRHLAVIFLDMDRFKIFNDTMGHVFGDQVLVEVGRRLVDCVRTMDTVARYGGDEFVILLEELAKPEEAMEVARRMRASLNRQLSLEGCTVKLSASFGVVPANPEETNDAEDMLRNATLAMHEARKHGPNRIMCFNPGMREQAVFLMTLENDLRLALARKEFRLAFQPIVHLGAPSMLGFEVLLRWKHPERGMVPPGIFIPVAEESGLIEEVGRWVLENTLKTAAVWRADGSGLQNMVFSVNISGRQFSRPGLVTWVENMLKDYAVPARALKLEITETSIMENAAEAVGKLSRLKDLGVKLSVDDFGTGYSSLSYLQRFPLDTLKIDLSFVQKLETNPGNREIVRAIVGLAHTLGLKVVAEGVETHGQEDILLGMGCDYGQGYRYARPLAEHSAIEFARSYHVSSKE